MVVAMDSNEYIYKVEIYKVDISTNIPQNQPVADHIDSVVYFFQI